MSASPIKEKQAHTATPGPWKLIERLTTFDIVGADGVKVLATSWHSSMRNPYPFKDEARANVRLATAAPDLLAKLAEIRKWMDADICGPWDAKFIEEIDGLIARATGVAK